MNSMSIDSQLRDNNYAESAEIGRMVTPYQNKKLPLYDWYNFNHSYSRNLVKRLAEEFQLSRRDRIIDPFCGSGTTLLVSKEMGIPAIGVDILPLSVFISNSKIFKYDKQKIKNSINEIRDILKNYKGYNSSIDRRKSLIAKFYSDEILDKIQFISEWIEEKADIQLKYFFFTALLSILGDVSYARKDGGFLRITREKKIPNLELLYVSRLQKMYGDIEFNNGLSDAYVKAIESDARMLPFDEDSFSAVITSPPYPNRHDYTRVYLLELVVGFIDTEHDLKALRYNTIRSHVEARKKVDTQEYILPYQLKIILEQLSKKKLPNRQIITMLEGYFEDMYLVMREIKRILKPKGRIACVISDVRYGGIKVPVGDILIDIGSNLDLCFEKKITARMRGNSPQQMKKYGKDPIEENIIIWRGGE